MNIVDRWDGKTYRRVIVAGNRPVEVAVRQNGQELKVEAGRLTKYEHAAVTAALVRLLGLHIDLSPFYLFAATDSRLGPLVIRFRGLKPPRFLTVFEALVNGITCQQLSLTAGLTILNRLVESCGPAVDEKHAFPSPADVAKLNPEQLRTLGYSHNKARALLELAQSAEQLNLENLGTMDNSEAAEHLVALRGVGRWTAEYILLRGLGRTDVFPGDDVGARNNLERWLNLRSPLDYNGVQRKLARWRPYGGLIYLHLLLRRPEEAGYLEAAPRDSR